MCMQKRRGGDNTHEKEGRRGKEKLYNRRGLRERTLVCGAFALDSQNRNIPRHLTHCEELSVNLALWDNYTWGGGVVT